MKRRIGLMALAVAVAAACSSGGPAGEEARLSVTGSATVTSGDRSETVTDDETVEFGDRITIDEGTAIIEFADGSTFELRSGEPASTIEVGIPLILIEGDLLIVDGFPAAAAIGDVVLTAQGVLEIDVDGLATVATAYTGPASITGLDGLADLKRLRRVMLSPSAQPEPAVYDGTDPWDRRYLGDAIAFGQRLEALARGYSNDIQPSVRRRANFFASVIPSLSAEREFNDDLIDDRAVGDTLIGAAIAVQGRQGTFPARWRTIFGFRDEGAAWGLVALDQGVSSAPVLETIELAIGESPLSDRPRPAPTTSRPVSTTPTTRPTGGSTTTSTSTTSSTTTTTTAPDEDVLPLIGPIVDPLDDLLDGLGLG